MFTGDTERNPLFWRRVNQLDVAMLFIETTFSDREQSLAACSRHLSPVTLVEELAQILSGKDYPVYITHTKPAEVEEIRNQIARLAAGTEKEAAVQREIQCLEDGTVMHVIG